MAQPWMFMMMMMMMMMIILPLFHYGCVTRLHKLTEKRGLRVCENRVLRRVFGFKRDEITEE
jgi:hypothetical protein